MQRMLLCGWDEDDTPILAALRAHAGLRPIAVGDASAVRLVRARGATRLPCYQHPRQMARVTAYDAALIADPALAISLAPVVAARRSALLLIGDRMDGAALTAAATAATRYDVPLAVLRPALRAAGLDAVRDLVAEDATWRPLVLSVELRGERSTPALLRGAVALALALLPGTPSEVIASRAGRDEHDPLAISAQLRFADGALAVVIARAANVEQARVALHATAGTADLTCEGDRSTFAVARWGADAISRSLDAGDSFAQEAVRAARIFVGSASDTAAAQRGGVVLAALEAAIATGRVHAVEAPSARAKLRVVPGRQPATAARAVTAPQGQLQLISTAVGEGA